MQEAQTILQTLKKQGSQTKVLDYGKDSAEYQQLQSAILAFLFYALNSQKSDNETDTSIWDMIPLLLQHLNDDQMDSLFSEIIFTAQNPAVYSAIAPGIRRRISAEECERAVINQIHCGDEHTRSNAIEFTYYVFGWDGYKITEEGRGILEESRVKDSE